MKKKNSILAILLFLTAAVFAQNNKDTVGRSGNLSAESVDTIPKKINVSGSLIRADSLNNLTGNPLYKNSEGTSNQPLPMPAEGKFIPTDSADNKNTHAKLKPTIAKPSRGNK